MQKAKIIKRAKTDFNEFLEVGEVVEILDNTFDGKLLVITKNGFKKLVDKVCLEVIEE